MLTKVEVRTRQGDLLTLLLDDISDGIVVQEIDGLDPVKTTLVSSSFAGQDGEQYQSSRRETRNIIIKLGLMPDPSVESVRSLRQRLYNYFPYKSLLDLRFYMADGLEVDISGRVETCESPMFVQEPTMNISLICFDPDFYEETPVEITGNTTSTTTETLVTYDGTIDTGLEFTLNVNRTLNAFTLYHRTPTDEVRTLDFSASLVAGDVLKISTVSGNKGATLIRSGTISSILYAISPQSNWTELMRGANHIRVYAVGTGVPFEINYINRYGGL